MRKCPSYCNKPSHHWFINTLSIVTAFRLQSWLALPQYRKWILYEVTGYSPVCTASEFDSKLSFHILLPKTKLKKTQLTNSWLANSRQLRIRQEEMSCFRGFRFGRTLLCFPLPADIFNPKSWFMSSCPIYCLLHMIIFQCLISSLDMSISFCKGIFPLLCCFWHSLILFTLIPRLQMPWSHMSD